MNPINGYTSNFDKLTYNSKENILLKKRNKNKSDKENVASLKLLKTKKAWDIALTNAKSIPMNGLMLYMSGSSVSIFSIMITGMLLFPPIKAILNYDKAFEKLEIDSTIDLSLQKLTYIILNLIIMAMGLWKCSTMGLLPTSTSDWLAFEEVPKFLERMLY